MRYIIGSENLVSPLKCMLLYPSQIWDRYAFHPCGLPWQAAFYFGTGYIKQDGLSYTTYPGQTPVQSPPQYFYYTKDHLGNIRSVVTKNPSTNAVTEVQRTHYYPYGGIIADISTGQNIQPRLYNGKELDMMHGLRWHDHGARLA